MKVGINCGHTISGPGFGAVGIIGESENTRLVGYNLMDKLAAAGISVIDCTIDEAESQSAYLAEAVQKANADNLDWFISIHFNASASHEGNGVEVYTYEGRQYEDALAVCENIAALGFKNRGVKAGTGLYVIRKTKAKSMLIEVCFCDNEHDVSVYGANGPEKVAQAIFDGLIGFAADLGQNTKPEMGREQFVEYVGAIAQKDWQERHIMLPSVVVAQAMKESAFGTSELAQNANALFGIKKNGWTGKTYVKQAVEQKPDGTYYVVDDTEWRAYDSWEESIIDHNDYIATRSTDGGKTLRYAAIIGNTDCAQVCKGLQEAGYATSLTYSESLINDYILPYNLMRFDVEAAPSDGTIWVCSIADVSTQTEAESYAKQFRQMGINVNVHHVQLVV